MKNDVFKKSGGNIQNDKKAVYLGLDNEHIRKLYFLFISNGLTSLNRQDDLERIYNNDFRWFKFLYSDTCFSYFKNEATPLNDFNERINYIFLLLKASSNEVSVDIMSDLGIHSSYCGLQGGIPLEEIDFIEYQSNLINDLLSKEDFRGLTAKARVYTKYLSEKREKLKTGKEKVKAGRPKKKQRTETLKDIWDNNVIDFETIENRLINNPTLTKANDKIIISKNPKGGLTWSRDKGSGRYASAFITQAVKRKCIKQLSGSDLAQIFKNTFDVEFAKENFSSVDKIEYDENFIYKLHSIDSLFEPVKNTNN